MNLYRLYAAGMGVGHLPDAGGALDQSCWIFHAFAVIAKAEAELDKQ